MTKVPAVKMRPDAGPGPGWAQAGVPPFPFELLDISWYTGVSSELVVVSVALFVLSEGVVFAMSNLLYNYFFNNKMLESLALINCLRVGLLGLLKLSFIRSVVIFSTFGVNLSSRILSLRFFSSEGGLSSSS